MAAGQQGSRRPAHTISAALPGSGIPAGRMVVVDRLCSDSLADHIMVVDSPGPGIGALRAVIAGLFCLSAVA